MMVNENNNRMTEQTAGGQGCDWSTVVTLAQRVIRNASMAVMAHAELDVCEQQAKTHKDV